MVITIDTEATYKDNNTGFVGKILHVGLYGLAEALIILYDEYDNTVTTNYSDLTQEIV